MKQSTEVTFTETPKPKKRAPAPEAPDPAAPPAPPAPTAEELQKRQEDMHKSLFGADLPKEPAAATPPPEPEAEPAPAAPEPESAPADPTPSPTPAPAPVLTRADIIDAARTGAKMVLETQQPAAPAPTPAPTPAQPAFELTPEDKADCQIVQFLEQSEPTKYAGRSQKFLDYTKAFYAYQDDWSVRNPGMEFDADASEHEAWYSKHDPGVTTAEIEQGKIDMAVDKAIKPHREKEQRESQQREQKEAVHQAMPVVLGNVQQRIVEMVGGVDTNLAAHITDKDGKPVLTQEAIDKIDAADPIAKRVLDDVVKYQLEPMVMALEMTAVPNSGYRLNPAVNPLHLQIADYIDKAERDMLAAPAEVRVQNGKEFATIGQFQRMERAIREGNGSAASKEQSAADLADRYYTLGIDEIEQIIVDECTRTAKTRIEFEDGLAKRKYGSSNGNGHPAPAQPQSAPTPTPAGKPRSPSLNSNGDTVVARDRNSPEPKNFPETMVSTLFK